MTKQEIFELFGQNITKLRKQNNMSLEELSEKTNISIKYLSCIENATARRIRFDHIIFISKALNVAIHNLFEK